MQVDAGSDEKGRCSNKGKRAKSFYAGPPLHVVVVARSAIVCKAYFGLTG
jgi:hypothetical protein